MHLLSLRKKRKITLIRKKFLSEKNAYRLSVFGIAFFFLFILINFLFGDWSFSLKSPLNEEKIGQFGDFVGGVIGSLFALVGVILYYVALKEQRKDLRMNQNSLGLQTKALNQQVEEFKAQEKELKETREVYEKQTKLFEKQTIFYEAQAREYKKQTDILLLQRFETSFLAMLKLLSEQKTNFFSNGEGGFSVFCIQFEYDEKKLKQRLKAVDDSFKSNIVQENEYLVNYTQLFFRILNLLKDTDIDEKSRLHYLKILNAQLTKKEKILLFYFARTRASAEERFLLVRYNMLCQINTLDKLECFFIEDISLKSLLSNFFLQIEKVVRLACDLFKSLDYDDDKLSKRESFCVDSEEIDFELNLTDENFCASIVYGTYVSKIDNKMLNDLTVFFFYDIFFISKFKQPLEDVFTASIEQNENFVKVTVFSKYLEQIL